jgi:hypothetical protein
VSNSHPLAGLWQPSYLHELDKLAQAAADTALAALDPQADADIRGICFVYAYKRLHKQLTPFRQHDPDRPETWPRQGDPGLLFALLRLLDVLEKLEPPAEIVPWSRGRKKQRWIDGGEAASNLKEQRPTVERLLKTAEEVHQLVSNLLARLISPSRTPIPAGNQEQSPDPFGGPTLNDAESNILEALDTIPMTGEQLAEKAGYPFNSNFRSTLANLKKRGILDNRGRGYFRKK